MTIMLRAQSEPERDEAILRAAEILASGGTVAIPTETVYGLAARADSDEAVARIYEAKGRPSSNPLIVHVLDESSARKWAREWPSGAARLARAYWPGPLTIVVPASEGISKLALAGGDTVGLRAPAHPVAAALLRSCGLPLAAPSANRSTELSPTTAQHVLESLDGRIDAILDAGPCDVGIESTVIDMSCTMPRVLRPGMISPGMIRQVLGEDVTAGDTNSGAIARSPGMQERHYAPQVELSLILRGSVVRDLPSNAFLVRFGDPIPNGQLGACLPLDPAEAARLLFATLHDIPESTRVILVDDPPAGEQWDAIRDRLRRASTPKQNG